MDQSTGAEGLIALLERDVNNLRNSIEKLVESNQELKAEIIEGQDEGRVYQSAIEVRFMHQEGEHPITPPSDHTLTRPSLFHFFPSFISSPFPQDNIVTIAKQRARMEKLEKELTDIKSHSISATQTDVAVKTPPDE